MRARLYYRTSMKVTNMLPTVKKFPSSVLLGFLEKVRFWDLRLDREILKSGGLTSSEFRCFAVAFVRV